MIEAIAKLALDTWGVEHAAKVFITEIPNVSTTADEFAPRFQASVKELVHDIDAYTAIALVKAGARCDCEALNAAVAKS